MSSRLQMCIQNTVKHLRWGFDQFFFTKHSTLDVWLDSEYASGLLKMIWCGFKRDTWEVWHMQNWLSYSLQTENFPLFGCHTWTFFGHSFIFFVPMSQAISVINRSGACYFCRHQTSGTYTGVCASDHMHQMEKTDYISPYIIYIWLYIWLYIILLCKRG